VDVPHFAGDHRELVLACWRAIVRVRAGFRGWRAIFSLRVGFIGYNRVMPCPFEIQVVIQVNRSAQDAGLCRLTAP
jgi:hypothetical protein